MSSKLSLNLTGLDTDTIIKNLMAIEQQPITRLQTKQAALLAKKTAWNTVKTQTNSLAGKIASLVKAASFTAKAATVSSSGVVSAKLESPSALLGEYEVHVTSLASAQVAQSAGFASSSAVLDPFVEGTVTLNGKSINITADDSLESIAAKINATEDVGVSASILETAPGVYKMILTSKATGSDGSMEFGGDLGTWRDLGVLNASDEVNQVRAAVDAAFTINGVSFTRSENSVSNAIPGVTFNLLSAGESAKSVIKVGYDDDSMVSAVKSFVTDYNALIDTIAKYTSWDADTKTGGILFGDSLIRGLLSEMRSVVLGAVEGVPDEFRTLSLIGLSTGSGTNFSREGRLTFDETKLRSALATDRDAVAKLFGAKAVDAALSSYGSTATAGSTLDSSLYPASSAISGNTSSTLWGAGGGWSSGTPGDFSDDWLEIDFGSVKTIDRVSIYTVDSEAMPASAYGIRDFTVEYWDGTGWVSLADVTDNTSGYRTFTFDAVDTNKIRINVTGSNDGEYSRIVAVQAFRENTGAFKSLGNGMNRYTAADGFFANRTESLNSQDKALQKRIEDMQKRLEMREASLRRQYTTLEVLLTQLNSQSAWLSAQMNALSSNSSE